MMLDEKTISCEWWIPSNPENKIKGTFTFNQVNGARLDLVEPFEKPYKTIFGENSFGYAITLQDCVPISLNMPGSPYSILAHQALLGAHFDKSEDVVFDSFHFQMSNLFDWLWKSGIKTENEFSNNIKISYDSPEPISFWINPEIIFEIVFQPSFSSIYQNREITLKQITQVSFNPQNRKNVDEYLQLMHHFRNFLCLVTQEIIYPQKIVGLREDMPTPIIDILYKLDAPISIESYVFNSLFLYKDIEDKFESCLQNWYRKYDDLEPVFTLYFGTHYGRFVYLNLRFLCLVQALEAYHRRTFGNEELSNTKHEDRVKNILDITSKEYKMR